MSKRQKYDKDFLTKFVKSLAEHSSQDDAHIRQFFIEEGLNPDEEIKKLNEKAAKLIADVKKKKQIRPKF
ncbi:MAG: hypothetical protein JSS79_18110 [Bacteroidetes bacterium]|nr:hypothetical protein [Bacteroidota bacterium]